MILQFIENASRLIMEWAIQKQYNQRPIIDQITDGYSYSVLRTEKVKKALL